MNPIRRAAVRSVASVAAASRTSVSSTSYIASQVARRQANVNLAAVAASRFARYFSQTARINNAEETSLSSGVTSEQTSSSPEAAAAEGQRENETPYGIFIHNIVFDASEEHLKEAFGHYGNVANSVISRDARGLSKGYGFVWYEDEESMKKAIEGTDGSFWHGRRLTVKARQPSVRTQTQRRNLNPTTSLYVGNMPYKTTDADLNELFRPLDGVEKVRIAVDHTTGWPRGFAHVDFHTVEQATKALEHLQGKELMSRPLRIDYAVSDARTTRRQRQQKSEQPSYPAEQE